MDRKQHVRNQDIAQQVLANAWFRRVWVLQELVLSKDPRIQIGRQSLPWKDCNRMLSNTFSVHSPALYLMRGMSKIRDTYWCRDDAMCSNNSGDVAFLESMLYLLEQRSSLEASDSRDFLFAHTALICFITRTPVPKLSSVDYNKSLAEVFMDMSRFCFELEGLPDLFVRATFWDKNRFLGELPSWVADVSPP